VFIIAPCILDSLNLLRINECLYPTASTIVVVRGWCPHRSHHCSGCGGGVPTEATIVVGAGFVTTDATILYCLLEHFYLNVFLLTETLRYINF